MITRPVNRPVVNRLVKRSRNPREQEAHPPVKRPRCSAKNIVYKLIHDGMLSTLQKKLSKTQEELKSSYETHDTLRRALHDSQSVVKAKDQVIEKQQAVIETLKSLFHGRSQL